MLAEARSKPNGADAWLGVAQAALQNGDPERCKVLLTSWLEQDPHNVAFNVLLSKSLQQVGTPEALEKSVAAARSAVQAAAGGDALAATVQLAVALGARARIHVRAQVDRQKDRAEAVQLLSTMLDSGAAAAAGAAPAALAGALYSLALLQAEAGQAAAAMASARAALQDAQTAAGASAAGAPAVTALCLVLVSVLLSSRRQFKLAASVLTAAPTSAALSKPGGGAPSRPLWSDCLVLRLRSRLLAAQNDTPAAIAALAQAKKLLAGWATAAGGGSAASSGVPAGSNLDKLNAELAKVWGELGAALAHAGQRPEAMAAADHALALAPWSAASRTALGAVYEALGEAGAAEAAYNDALALDPTCAAALLRQGSLHARRGSRPDLAVARDLLAEALRYEPAAAAGWYGLGRVAAALGHGSEAEGHLLTAVQLAGAAPLLPYAELPLAPA